MLMVFVGIMSGKAQYATLYPFVSDNDLIGFINKQGEIVIEPQFDDIDDFQYGCFPKQGLNVKREGISYYIDETGNVVNPPQNNKSYDYYEHLIVFTDGNIKFKHGKLETDGKWGFKDKQGNIVIAAQFDYAHGFSEGLAAVRINDNWGYIDTTNRIVIKPKFRDAKGFHEGLAAIYINDKWGYIDTTGRVIIKPKFEDAQEFHEGLAVVMKKGKYGYINKKGKMIIKPHYDQADCFIDGLAAVEQHKFMNRGFINKKGYMVTKDYCVISDFHEDLALALINGRHGFIDKSGNIVIQPNSDYSYDDYYNAYPFCEGFSKVKINDKYGYINTQGRFVITPQYDYADNFHQGIALVKMEETLYYIDTLGNIVFQYQDNKCKLLQSIMIWLNDKL